MNEPRWGIVEVMGHQRWVGLVREWSFAGSTFVQVQVPLVGLTPGRIKAFSPSAIFSIEFVDEATARALLSPPSWQPPKMFPELHSDEPDDHELDDGYDAVEDDVVEDEQQCKVTMNCRCIVEGKPAKDCRLCEGTGYDSIPF